MIFKY